MVRSFLHSILDLGASFSAIHPHYWVSDLTPCFFNLGLLFFFLFFFFLKSCLYSDDVCFVSSFHLVILPRLLIASTDFWFLRLKFPLGFALFFQMGNTLLLN